MVKSKYFLFYSMNGNELGDENWEWPMFMYWLIYWMKFLFNIGGNWGGVSKVIIAKGLNQHVRSWHNQFERGGGLFFCQNIRGPRGIILF